MGTLLQIPRGASASDALLRVTAAAEHEGGACSDMYFKALNITGLWVSAQQKEGYMYTAGAPQPVAGWRTYGKVEVKVAWGRTLGGVEYLNFMVRHLTRVGQDIGGLLGMDDYTQAAKRDPSCGSAILVQLSSAPQEASFAMGHVIKRLLAYGLEAVPFGTHQPAYVVHTCSPTPSLPERSCAASRRTDCDSYREAFRHSAVASR